MLCFFAYSIVFLVPPFSSLYTIQLGLRTFIGMYNAQWHYLMAAALFAILPALLVFLVGQRYFVEGIATSGLKG